MADVAAGLVSESGGEGRGAPPGGKPSLRVEPFPCRTDGGKDTG